MTTENNHIDQLFKEKLGNLEKTPPFGLMPGINDRIIAAKKVRQLNQLKTIIGIAAAMVLIIMAGWFTLDQDQTADNLAPQQIQKVDPADKQTQEIASPSVQPSENQLANNQTKSVSTVASPAAQQSGTRSSRKSHDLKASAPSVVKTEPGKNNQVALASADQPKEEPKDKPAKNEVAPAPQKKEANSYQKSNPTQQGNKQYYSAYNSGNTPEKKSENSLKQWSLKAEIAQTFTTMQHFASANPESKSINTVGGGMIASLRVSKKVTLSSGIRYSQMKQGTHTSYTLNNTAGIIYLQPIEKKGNITRDVSLYLPAVSSIVYSNGMKTNPENVFISDLSQEFQYLEVPIQANYKLLENKFSVGVTGGISTNFLIGNKATVTENGIKLSTGDTNNLRDVIYSGSAGIELGYDLGKRMILTVEPRVKQYLHSVSSNDLVNVKPLQLGIFTGISYTFE